MKRLFIGCVALFALWAQITNCQPPKLKNYGNTCYLNAALQALLSLNDFTDLLKDKSDLYQEGTLSRAFCDFVGAVKSGKTDFTGSDNELKRLIDIAWPMMIAKAGGQEACGQQDASEFIILLIGQLMLEANKTEKGRELKDKIYKLFKSETSSYVTCKITGDTPFSLPEEKHFSFNIPMPAKSFSKLDESFNALFSLKTPELNFEYTPPGKGKQIDCKKFTSLKSLAPHLILNLNRFKVKEGKVEKDDAPIMVPLTPKINAIDYELKSVIVQSGGIGGGHYVAYVKDTHGDWWKCDDTPESTIKKIDLNELNSNITRGYNFFYEAKEKPITPPTPPETGPETTPLKLETPFEKALKNLSGELNTLSARFQLQALEE